MPTGKRFKIVVVAFTALLVMSVAVFSVSYMGLRGCASVSASTSKRLVEYVRGKLRVQTDAVVELAYAEPVGDTCYQAVHFRVKGRGGTDLVAFLSPDQKFLSRDLTDWKMDTVLNSSRGLPQEQPPQKLNDAEFLQMTSPKAPTKGSASAPIKIALFTDFQCPYCKQQGQILKDQFKDTEVQVFFHHLPLRNHPWARPAAEMADCVARQSNAAFWDLFDSLYQNQETLTAENLKQFVRKRIGGKKEIDIQGFDACVAEHRSGQQVDDDLALAATYRLSATPSMFINGIRKQGVVSAEDIRRLAQRPTTAQSTTSQEKGIGSE